MGHSRRIRIKGWLQTVLVHGLLPRAFDRWTPPMRLRDRIALAIQLPVQLLCLASHPVGMAVAFNDPHGPLAVLLFAGYALTIVVFMVAAIRVGRSPWDAFALPLYSFLHTAAMAIAVIELVCAPSLWRKTEHGLVRNRPKLSGPS